MNCAQTLFIGTISSRYRQSCTAIFATAKAGPLGPPLLAKVGGLCSEAEPPLHEAASRNALLQTILLLLQTVATVTCYPASQLFSTDTIKKWSLQLRCGACGFIAMKDYFLSGANGQPRKCLASLVLLVA